MASLRSSARSRGARPRLYGSEQPRVFTPPLRELTPQTSLGFQAIEFATDVCGIDLFPWQRWLLIHALELAPDLTVDTMHKRGRLDPLFRFRKVVVLVARQNGKSTLSQVLALFFLYVIGTSLILGTAQDLDTAEEVWEGALDIIEDTPELAELADKPVKVNGKKTIRLLSGERYKVKASNRRAGRGLSGDLILLDELREHQSWDAWGAITKTTMARAAAMIWALSNAGDASSVVLRYLRKTAHAALGDPDGINAEDDPEVLLPSAGDVAEMVDLAEDDDGADVGAEDFEEDPDSLGIFEWSAKPGRSVADRQGWVEANPSLGYGISERTLAGDAKGDPEWVFRTECLCQWSDGTLDGPFPPGSWDAGRDPSSCIIGDVVACVDVSHDRGRAHIAVAGRRADGRVHVEIVASRAGVEWVRPWLTDPDHPHRKAWPLTGQSNGAPVSSLLPALAEAGINVVDWQGGDLARGTGGFYDMVRGIGVDGVTSPGVFHLEQPLLDVAAANAVTRPLGDGYVWDRRHSPVDIAPLVAVTGAAWLLTRPIEAPPVSAYEDRGVLTV